MLFATIMLQHIFTQPYNQPSPYTGVSTWWGASDASATKSVAQGHPWIGGWVSDIEAPDTSTVWWFQLEIKPEECP